MDDRTNFKFTIDGNESEYDLHCWQDALNCFLHDLNASGFEIPPRKVKQLVEFAKFNRITVRED